MFSTKPLAAIFAVAFLFGATMPAQAAGTSVARIDAAACDKPNFPVQWHEVGDGAKVVVSYLVGADGKVVGSKIVKSSGVSYIDHASERAGARCKFVPAEGSTTDASWTKVTYSWIVD
jgi:protein TonB